MTHSIFGLGVKITSPSQFRIFHTPPQPPQLTHFSYSLDHPASLNHPLSAHSQVIPPPCLFIFSYDIYTYVHKLPICYPIAQHDTLILYEICFGIYYIPCTYITGNKRLFYFKNTLLERLETIQHSSFILLFSDITIPAPLEFKQCSEGPCSFCY